MTLRVMRKVAGDGARSPSDHTTASSFSLSPAHAISDARLRRRSTTDSTSFFIASANSSTIGGTAHAIMKSCHTITPFASHQSKNASGSYTGGSGSGRAAPSPRRG